MSARWSDQSRFDAWWDDDLPAEEASPALIGRLTFWLMLVIALVAILVVSI